MTLCEKYIDELNKDKESALRYFIKKYEDSLGFYAYKLIRNREAAEEIVSEAFFRLWQNRTTMKNGDYLRSFLFLVTKNACLDFIGSSYERNMGNQVELSPYIEEQKTDALMQIIHHELLQMIAVELDNLPKKQAKIFRMSFLEGMETEEICEVLNTSTSSVYFSRSKALANLRKIFTKRGISLVLLFVLSFIKGI